MLTGPDGKCYESTTLYPPMCANIMKLPSNPCSIKGFTLPNGITGCDNLHNKNSCYTKVDPTKHCVCPYGCEGVRNFW